MESKRNTTSEERLAVLGRLALERQIYDYMEAGNITDAMIVLTEAVIPKERLALLKIIAYQSALKDNDDHVSMVLESVVTDTEGYFVLQEILTGYYSAGLHSQDKINKVQAEIDRFDGINKVHALSIENNEANFEIVGLKNKSVEECDEYLKNELSYAKTLLKKTIVEDHYATLKEIVCDYLDKGFIKRACNVLMKLTTDEIRLTLLKEITSNYERAGYEAASILTLMIEIQTQMLAVQKGLTGKPSTMSFFEEKSSIPSKRL